MSLQIEIKPHKSKKYELQVCVELTQFENTNIPLYSFPDVFMEQLKKIPRLSVGTADIFYKAILSEDCKKVEIWHLNAIGNADRLLAIVTDNGKYHNPFNF